MPVPFFSLQKQIDATKAETMAAIEKVVESSHFILGPQVAALEKTIAEKCETKHAVGVASGTDALHLALRALGIAAGDEVITSPFTFVATIEVICYIGAKPVFADIDPVTFNLDPKKVEAKITPKTKAILPVHLYGQAADMDPLLAIAKKNGLKIVEDCCQAIGAKYRGKPVGAIGDAGGFSFFPTKNLGCFGDGGIITTNSDVVAEESKVYRGHGSKTTYMYDLIGYNSRLDEIQAAILLVRMKHLETWTEKRRKNAAFYSKELQGLKEIVCPVEKEGNYHVYNQYTIRIKQRNELQQFLKEKGVGSAIYYPLSLHLHKAYAGLGYKRGDLPESEKAEAEVLSLPIFPELTDAELAEVVAAVKAFYV
jgi:dTDP-4-amino-4,6-dideoxygalactose transaminase